MGFWIKKFCYDISYEVTERPRNFILRRYMGWLKPSGRLAWKLKCQGGDSPLIRRRHAFFCPALPGHRRQYPAFNR